MTTQHAVCIISGEALGRYGFGHGHPFGTDRLEAFWEGLSASGLAEQVQLHPPVMASGEEIESFHDPAYVLQVRQRSEDGWGLLDYGDTPAYRGVYETAATVVGSSLDAVQRVIAGSCRRAFVPIAGLHHARRRLAGGFCVFNDCGVVIELLRSRHGVQRIAYVDIDAHHGDGVYYGFESDPDLIVADIHEDGRFLYPGTGSANEIGRGAASGSKLNLPLPPGADDDAFLAVWPQVEELIDQARPEIILLQCGADSLAGDPLTHLAYSAAVHEQATRSLCRLADRHCNGRLVAFGGGGYNHANLVSAWTAVIRELLAA